MKLKNWTDQERGRQAALARIVGVSLPTMTRWVNGQDVIPEDRARQIERATGGAVTMEEMLPDKVAEFEYMRNRPVVDAAAIAMTEDVEPNEKGKVIGCDVTPQGVGCSPMPDLTVSQ